jgi:glutathione S-transferase
VGVHARGVRDDGWHQTAPLARPRADALVLAAVPEIDLIQFPGGGRLESASPYCVKVQRLLRFKRLPFSVTNVNLPPKSRVNPARKLPVLVYDGEAIPDSSRIAREIEQRHPEPSLVPERPEERALAWLLEDWADESLYWMLLYLRWMVPENAVRMKRLFATSMGIPLGWFGPAIVQRTIRRSLVAQGMGRLSPEAFFDEFTQALGSLDRRVAATEFLAGARPSLADVAVFAMLQGVREGPLDFGPGLFDGHAHLLRWYQRVDGLTRG